MTRLHLVRTWDEQPEPATQLPGVTHRPLAPGDADALGSLFWHGFADEDAYASEAEARTEAVDTLAGAWGPVSWDASLVALADDEAVAATVLVSDEAHDGLPLLAYVLTLPGFRRQGIAASLILSGLRALHDRGIRELHLAVLPGNPAVSLYTKLSFVDVASSQAALEVDLRKRRPWHRPAG